MWQRIKSEMMLYIEKKYQLLQEYVNITGQEIQ